MRNGNTTKVRLPLVCRQLPDERVRAVASVLIVHPEDVFLVGVPDL